MFYVNLKVFQQPIILFKYLFEAQFEYWKFELSTKDGSFTTSSKHSGIGNQLYFLDFFIIIMKTTFIVFDLNPMQYESAQYFGPVICNNIPIDVRSIKNFDTFHTEIRKWKPKNC